MREHKSSISIIFHSIISFLIWIILLLIANILVSYINNPIYELFILFFNSLLVLFFILFVIGMINSLFWNFNFPLNLFAPISSAILSIFIVDLIYKIIVFTQSFTYFNIWTNIPLYLIYVLVFFATLIFSSLILIIEEAGKTRERKYSKETEGLKQKRHQGLSVSNEEIKNEFKKVAYNIGEALNKPFEDKKKDKGKKKKKSKKR